MWIDDNYYSLENLKSVKSEKPYNNGYNSYFEILLHYKDNTLVNIRICKVAREHEVVSKEYYNILNKLKEVLK